MLKGTCLQTYIPIRSEPRSGAEMVSTLIFGESYTIIEELDEWLSITTIFDNYNGWISKNTFDEFTAFDTVCNSLFLLAKAGDKKIFIPCGGLYPSSLKFEFKGNNYTVEQILKPSHHLPLNIRLLKTAQQFLNIPYLWGGRSFMGIDCSGFIQVVFKANGIEIARDTSLQILQGKTISFSELKTGDLIFFKKPNTENVSHIGMMLKENTIIHSSGVVKIQQLESEGIYNLENNLEYKILECKRII